jgi:hypothetical protein
MRRAVTIIIALLDSAVAAGLIYAAATSQSDNATRGLDNATWEIAIVLFAVTGLPALGLAAWRRAPGTALTLSLLFPALLAALFAAAVIMFA